MSNKFGLTMFLPLLLLCCATKQPPTQEVRPARWDLNFPDHWRIEILAGTEQLTLLKPGKMGRWRAPTSRAILIDPIVTSFELSVQGYCLTDTTNAYRDLCLFFGYQDSTHFYYVHFSGISDQAHNIIAIVNNCDRSKINAEPAGGSTAGLTEKKWYYLKVVRNVGSGRIEAFIDDMEHPVLTAMDKTFLWGQVGVGSFDDTGMFRAFQVTGDIKIP